MLSCHPLGLPWPPKNENASNGIKRHNVLPNALPNVNLLPSSFTAFVPVISFPNVLPDNASWGT